jgi:hypothetical protein
VRHLVLTRSQQLREHKNKADFLRSVDRFMSEEVPTIANEERLGIGLYYCTAYLASLRWEDIFRLPGVLKIASSAEGATVSFQLPPRRLRGDAQPPRGGDQPGDL